MHFRKVALVFIHASLASAASVTFSEVYDNSSAPLDQLACYKNGAIMPRYTWKTFGEVTTYIVGLGRIDGPDSPLCASCWELEYGKKIHHFLAFDGASSEMVISREAMQSLTGYADEKLGAVSIDATKVDLLDCGIYDPPEKEL